MKSTDENQAKAIHGMASGAFPFLARIEPKLFLKGVGASELVIGGLLLLPIVPAGVAGLALCGFSRRAAHPVRPHPRPARRQDATDAAGHRDRQGTSGWPPIGAGLVIDAVLSENDTPESSE